MIRFNSHSKFKGELLFCHSYELVCIFLGNRMFGFKDEEVDFYLPQLINMYIQMHDVAEAVHPYLVHR